MQSIYLVIRQDNTKLKPKCSSSRHAKKSLVHLLNKFYLQYYQSSKLALYKKGSAMAFVLLTNTSPDTNGEANPHSIQTKPNLPLDLFKHTYYTKNQPKHPHQNHGQLNHINEFIQTPQITNLFKVTYVKEVDIQYNTTQFTLICSGTHTKRKKKPINSHQNHGLNEFIQGFWLKLFKLPTFSR